MPKDVMQFQYLCESGTIYECLMDVWQKTRDETKLTVFSRVLFNRVDDNELRAQFKKRFPHVLEVIESLKRHDYKRMGQMLQRAESSVIIHRACEQLRLSHPEVPLYTIHDSIGTTDEHLETVRAVMLDSFAQVGMKPKLK